MRAALLGVLLAGAACAQSAVQSPGAPVESPAALPDLYGHALAALRARAEPRPDVAVKFRLGHLINEDKVPDVPYSLIQNSGGAWNVLVPTRGQAQWYKKGDLVMGARILEITRASITIEFRGKQATIAPRPWPGIRPARMVRVPGGEWAVYLKLGQTDKLFRRGDIVRESLEDGVREAQVVEVTSGSVTCEFLGERRMFYGFPDIPCKLTKNTPEGLMCYVATETGLRPFRTGEKYLDAELMEVTPQQSTWKFHDETRAFNTLAYPDLACSGTTKISGVWFAYFDGENQGYRAGQLVRGARIDEIQPGLVKVTYAGIQSEVPATYQSDRH